MALNHNGDEEVVDPHGSKRVHDNWVNKRGKRLPTITGDNKKIILQFLDDMANGININKVKKGSRSYSRLNALRSRIPQIAGFIKNRYQKNIIDISKREINSIFVDMEKGVLKKADGGRYKSWDDYVKDFKSFWHWWMKYSKEENNVIIDDISEDLDGSGNAKPKWHYFTIEQLQKMMDKAKFEYKVIMLFMFDSGIRSPQELANIKVKDITEIKNSDRLLLNIRDDISKTFGRKIKLMISHKLIKRYIKEMELQKDDFLFKISPRIKNQYLTRLGFEVLGIGKCDVVEKPHPKNSTKKIKYKLIKDGITMYDFRHNSACYWLQRYKSIPALIYRFGWKNPEMVEYYSEWIGFKDQITEDDLDDAETRTELQKQLDGQQKKNELLQEQFVSQEKQINKLQRMMKEIQVERIQERKKASV